MGKLKVFRTKHIKKTRKRHQCFDCYKWHEKGAELVNITFNYDNRLVSIYRCVECAKRNESTGVKKAVEVVEKEPYGDLLDAMILYWLFVAFITFFVGFVIGQNWFYLLQTFNGF